MESKVAIIAPGKRRYLHEAWGREISDIAARFPKQTYLIATGSGDGLWSRHDNIIVVRHSPFLFGLFAALAFRYSRTCDLSMLECSPDTEYFSWLSALLKPEKTIYRIKSFSWIDPDEKMASGRLARRLERFRLVIVHDEACYRAVTRHVAVDRVAVVPPGINLSKYPASEPPSDAEYFNVLFASSPVRSNPYPEIFVWKGIDKLLRSLSILERQGRKVRLVLAWREAYLRQLMALIKEERLRNVSVINGFADMVQLYRTCHVTVFPATSPKNSPCFPSTVMESLSVGRPVVVTNVLHVSELINRTGCGVICKPAAESVADAVCQVMDNYEEFAQNSRRVAVEYFDENRSFETLGRLLGVTNNTSTNL